MVVELLLPIALPPLLPPETAAPLLLLIEFPPLAAPPPELLLLLVCTAPELLFAELFRLLPMALLLLLLLELPPEPPPLFPLLLLPGRKPLAVDALPATPPPALDEVDEELEEFGKPAAVALELLPDEDSDDDDFPEAFDLRCLNEDETLLPPLPPLPLPPPRLDKPPLPPPNVLLVILMLVADVEAEFMVESISFSGDEHESEEVSCCMGLYGGIVLTLPPFFCNVNVSRS